MISVLVLIACLQDNSGCVVRVLSNEQPYHQCMASSMPSAAQWIGDHPKYKVKSITCADPKHLKSLLGRTQA